MSEYLTINSVAALVGRTPGPFRKWSKDTKSLIGSTTSASYLNVRRWRGSLTVYPGSALKRPNSVWKSVWEGVRDEEDDHKEQTPRANWGFTEHRNGLWWKTDSTNRLRRPLWA